MENHFDPATHMVNCVVCQRQIAALAETCPGCGAPNEWKHPEVIRFLSQVSTISTAKQFYHWHNKTAVWGEARGSVPWWIYVLALLSIPPSMLWTWFGGSAWVGVAVGLALGLLASFGTRKDAFKADFRNRHWASTNEKLWRPLRSFFKL